jgi:hypothetical protein
MRIPNDNRQTDQAEAREVVDVIADVSHLRGAEPSLPHHLLEHVALVGHRLEAAEIELPSPRSDNWIGFGRHHKQLEAPITQQIESQPVTAPASHGLSTVLANQHRVIGEDSIEVEHYQPDPAREPRDCPGDRSASSHADPSRWLSEIG